MISNKKEIQTMYSCIAIETILFLASILVYLCCMFTNAANATELSVEEKNQLILENREQLESKAAETIIPELTSPIIIDNESEKDIGNTQEEIKEDENRNTYPSIDEDENTQEVMTTDEQIVQEILFPESEVTGNDEIDIDVLAATISIIAPDLIGIEDAIIEIYETTGIKPSFQLATFCLESGFGTSNLAKNKNNIAGWNAYPTKTKSSYEHATTFDTMSECVLTVGHGLHEKYVQQGRTTVDSIAKKYCPGNCTNWASSVRSIMNDIENTYKSLA